jgi:hypothetical protein
MSTWEFSVRYGGSKRVEDGLRFNCSSYPSKEPMKQGDPDWVWLVHWSNPIRPPVWLDPVKRGLETPTDVERYIDEKWPLTPENSDA